MSFETQVSQFCAIGIGGTDIDTQQLKIFVGGLPPDFSSQNLYEKFHHFGEIREACIIPDRFRVRSRGYGFITFRDENTVKNVLKSIPFFVRDSNGNKRKLTVVLASANSKRLLFCFQNKKQLTNKYIFLNNK